MSKRNLVLNLSQGLAAQAEALQLLSSSKEEQSTFLEQIFLRLQLMRLYQTCFPEQYQHSQANTVVSHLSQHTARELEFFELVNEHLFPVETEPEGLQLEITIAALNVDWWDEDWEELEILEQCYLCLHEHHDWEEWLESLDLDTATLASMPKPFDSARQREATLAAVFGEADPPLNQFPLVLEVFDKATGNCWIDTYSDYCETLPWTYESCEQLASAYEAAATWKTAYRNLQDWLQAEPSRVGTLVTYWNKLVGVEQDYEQLCLPFSTTVSSNEFVAGNLLNTGRRQQAAQFQAHWQTMHTQIEQAD